MILLHLEIERHMKKIFGLILLNYTDETDVQLIKLLVWIGLEVLLILGIVLLLK